MCEARRPAPGCRVAVGRLRPPPGVQVTVTGVANPEVSLSYTVQEPLRGGNLLVEAAEALGVPPGPAYSALKAGESVENSSGAVVHAHQVRPAASTALCIGFMHVWADGGMRGAASARHELCGLCSSGVSIVCAIAWAPTRHTRSIRIEWRDG